MGLSNLLGGFLKLGVPYIGGPYKNDCIQDGIEAVKWAWILIKFGTEKAIIKYCDWFTTLVRKNSTHLPQIKTLFGRRSPGTSPCGCDSQKHSRLSRTRSCKTSPQSTMPYCSPRRRSHATNRNNNDGEIPRDTREMNCLVLGGVNPKPYSISQTVYPKTSTLGSVLGWGEYQGR